MTTTAAAATAAKKDTVTTHKAKPAPWVHFAAGNIGGIFGLSLAYPLDTIKVRMQTRPAGTYSGIVDCGTALARQEGVLSLYRGLLSPLLGYGLIKAAAFGSYNQAKTALAQFQGSSSSSRSSSSSNTSPLSGRVLLELIVCGAYAGFIQTFVRAPVEQIKVVMQARAKNAALATATATATVTVTVAAAAAPAYANTWQCLRDVIRTEGVKQGLFRAFWPTLFREIPQYAIYYPSYEASRYVFATNFAPDGSTATLSPLWTAMAGGIAGVSQWAPTYPLDVIKSRVSAAPPGTYSSFMDCVRKSYRAEGIPVFFRGISASLIRAFPLHGAVFLGYEMTVKLFEK